MGNQNNSGVLLFTVYQNGQPARFWPCYLVEQVTAAFSGKANSIAMFSPLGSGTEANVFVSDLSVTAAPTRALAAYIPSTSASPSLAALR